MITPLTVYLITRADAICHLLENGMIVSLLIGGFTLATWLITRLVSISFGNEPGAEKVANATRCYLLKFILPAAIALGLMHACVPTTKELCAIMVVPVIANNEKVQDIGTKFYELATEWLEELKPNTNANTKNGAETSEN